MDKSKVLTHPYHLVDPSPWPIFMSKNLYIVVGTGFMFFSIFVLIVFLRHIPHTGLLQIARIWVFGNKSGIKVNYFKVKLLGIVIFSRIIYLFSLRYSVFAMSGIMLDSLTIFSLVLNVVIWFLFTDIFLAFITLSFLDVISGDFIVFGYHISTKLGCEMSRIFIKDSQMSMIQRYKSGIVIEDMSHPVGVIRRPRYFFSPIKPFSSGKNSFSTSIQGIETKIAGYNNNVLEKVSYVDDLQMFNNRISKLSDYNSVSNKLIRLNNYSESWIQSNPKIRNFAHLSNKAFVLESNDDGALEMMHVDQAWINFFLKDINTIAPNVKMNKDGLFATLHILADRRAYGIKSELDLLDELEAGVFGINGSIGCELIQVLNKNINTAIRQQETMNIVNAAYGGKIVKPLNYGLNSALEIFRNLYFDTWIRPAGSKDLIIKSGFGDGIIVDPNGKRALIEFKNRLYFDIIINSQIAFIEEVNSGPVYRATFFDRFLTLDLPEFEFYNRGFELGEILKKYDLVDFIIAGTNIDSSASRSVSLELTKGVKIVAESDQAVVFEISEFQRMYNKIKNRYFDPSIIDEKVTHQQEQYFKNLAAFRAGMKDGGLKEMELRRQSIIRKN